MTHDELNALEALEKAATPGPWTSDKPMIDPITGFRKGVAVAATYGKQMIYADPPGGSYPAADQRFIAALRNAAPNLIALARCEIEREARVSTHAPGCHTWGPRHYDCLMRRYEATHVALTQAQEALEPIVVGMEDDPDYGSTVRMSAISQENMTRARSALDAIRKVLR